MVQLKTMLDWDDYRIFLAVARTPSIRAAANDLKVSHSTVLRRVDRLEEKLGARLFERRSVGFRLTPSGEEVLQGAHDIEESVQSINRSVTGRDSALEGVVKVSMPGGFIHHALFPDLKKFGEQFPNIQLDIDLSENFVDLSKREADIALRITTEPPEDLVGRKLSSVLLAASAHKDHVELYEPHKLDSKALRIGYGTPETFVCRFGFDHLSVCAYCDNVLLQLRLALQGVGVVALPVLMADAEPSLVRLSEPIHVGDVWLLYHTDLRYTSRVRAVRDFFEQTVYEQLGKPD